MPSLVYKMTTLGGRIVAGTHVRLPCLGVDYTRDIGHVLTDWYRESSRTDNTLPSLRSKATSNDSSTMRNPSMTGSPSFMTMQSVFEKRRQTS
jgi:hypothetical protein